MVSAPGTDRAPKPDTRPVRAFVVERAAIPVGIRCCVRGRLHLPGGLVRDSTTRGPAAGTGNRATRLCHARYGTTGWLVIDRSLAAALPAEPQGWASARKE